MLVSGVVVEDLGVDGVEKADELLVAVTLIQRPMTVPSSTSRAGKQRGRAVPLVVVRHAPSLPFFMGRPVAGAVERLDPGQHQQDASHYSPQSARMGQA